MGRTVHRSAVHAMALLGITPIWVWPRQDAGPGLAGRIQADDVAKALQKHPDAKAVYLTTPDYYGVMSDLNAICAAAQQYNVPVIVDNAHGAHLFFLDRKLHPLSQGAAMCADSAHKTLPVLTGGAYFQIGSGRYLPQVRAAMALFGSTSPSFPILLSLDLCRAWLEEEGKAAYAKTAAQANELNAYAKHSASFHRKGCATRSISSGIPRTRASAGSRPPCTCAVRGSRWNMRMRPS